MPIKIPNETRRKLTEATKAYVHDEWNLEIGDLKAGLFAEFVVETYGPAMYNAAIRDAQRHLGSVVADLDLVLADVEE